MFFEEIMFLFILIMVLVITIAVAWLLVVDFCFIGLCFIPLVVGLWVLVVLFYYYFLD